MVDPAAICAVVSASPVGDRPQDTFSDAIASRRASVTRRSPTISDARADRQDGALVVQVAMFADHVAMHMLRIHVEVPPEQRAKMPKPTTPIFTPDPRA